MHSFYHCTNLPKGQLLRGEVADLSFLLVVDPLIHRDIGISLRFIQIPVSGEDVYIKKGNKVLDEIDGGADGATCFVAGGEPVGEEEEFLLACWQDLSI